MPMLQPPWEMLIVIHQSHLDFGHPSNIRLHPPKPAQLNHQNSMMASFPLVR